MRATVRHRLLRRARPALSLAVLVALLAPGMSRADAPPPPAPPIFPTPPGAAQSPPASTGPATPAPTISATPRPAFTLRPRRRTSIATAAIVEATPSPTPSPSPAPSSSPSPAPAATVITRDVDHQHIPLWLLIALGASGVANMAILGAYLNHRRWAARAT